MKEKKCPCAGNSIVRSKGEYTIFVERLTFNMKNDLPYPLFGTLYLSGQNFATPLAPYLPSGVTVTSAIIANGIIELTYTDGSYTDIIHVGFARQELSSYPEMLANLNTNYLNTELVYFCSNVEFEDAVVLDDLENCIIQSKPLYLLKIGGLSSKSNELITPLTRRSPNTTQKNIVEIYMRSQDIKPDTVWIHVFPASNRIQEGERLVFYWQVFINEIVNMNDERRSLEEIRTASKE